MKGESVKRLTYSIYALCNSDIAVLKSMILLAEKQSGCIWLCANDPLADVLILGPEVGAIEYNASPGQVLMSVGHRPVKHFYHLETPLHFPQVVKILAAVSESVEAEQASAQSFSHSQLQPSVWDFGFASAGGVDVPAPSSGKRYHLNSWPPAGVIGNNRSHLRAAAALTGKSLTSSELAEKTNLPLADCREFLGKLSDSKCLKVVPAQSAEQAPTASSQTSSSVAPATEPPPVATAPSGTRAAAAPVASSGLFERIRSRLAFLGKSAS